MVERWNGEGGGEVAVGKSVLAGRRRDGSVRATQVRLKATASPSDG